MPLDTEGDLPRKCWPLSTLRGWRFGSHDAAASPVSFSPDFMATCDLLGAGFSYLFLIFCGCCLSLHCLKQFHLGSTHSLHSLHIGSLFGSKMLSKACWPAVIREATIRSVNPKLPEWLTKMQRKNGNSIDLLQWSVGKPLTLVQAAHGKLQISERCNRPADSQARRSQTVPQQNYPSLRFIRSTLMVVGCSLYVNHAGTHIGPLWANKWRQTVSWNPTNRSHIGNAAKLLANDLSIPS